MSKNNSKFYTFGTWIKRAVDTTSNASVVAYDSTKTGVTAAYEATKQAVNDTVEGYNSVK